MKWKLIKLITTYYKVKRWIQNDWRSSRPTTVSPIPVGDTMTEEELLALAKGIYSGAHNAEEFLSTPKKGSNTNATGLRKHDSKNLRPAGTERADESSRDHQGAWV